MKKGICIFLVCLILIGSLFSTAIASDYSVLSEGQEIVFDENKYDGLSLEEAGKRKLIDSGYSQNLVDSMPLDNLQKIGASPACQQISSYYVETENENGNLDLMKVSKVEYDKAVEDELQARADEIARQITVVDESGSIIYDPATVPTPQQTTISIDGGSLSIVTTLFQITDAATSQYMVVSGYAWTTPPKYRGTDYFGITRDTNCSVVPGTFGNSVSYKEYRYYYLATNSGVQSTLHSTNDYKDDGLANEDSAANGFVIKDSLPVDVNPPSSMLAGSSFLSRNYANIQGTVWYQGVLQSPSSNPSHLNHWGTYWHQKSTIWGTISLSVPKGASFTIDPKAKFYNPLEDSILVKWENGKYYIYNS